MAQVTRRTLLQTGVAASAYPLLKPNTARAAALQSPFGDPRAHEIRQTLPGETPLDALAVGNGRLGALVMGQPRLETIPVNEDTLWSGQPHRVDMVNSEELLAQIRDAVFRADYATADRLCQRIQGQFSHSYAPLANIEMAFDFDGTIRAYERRLDFDEATAVVKFSAGGVEFSREIFASHPAQLLLVRLRASRSGALNVALRLSSLLQASAVVDAHGITLQGKAPTHCDPSYRRVVDAVRYSPAPGQGMNFATRAELISTDGRVRTDGDRLHIEQAGEVVLAVGAATGFRGFDQPPDRSPSDVLTRARRAISDARGRSFDVLRAAHMADHRAFYRRVMLEIGPGSAAPPSETDAAIRALRYFNFSRYLLIASSRPGTQAANLQGIWSWEVRPPWSSNFTTNINLQQNYWGAESCNLAELAEPMFDFVQNVAHTGAETAKILYGAKGWCVHHNSDIWCLSTPVGEGSGTPTWANWAMAGPWLVRHLWDHYLFSQDREFLQSRAYPLLKSCSEFCVDWLVRDPRSGRITTAPSVSTENRFKDPDGAPRSVSAGCTMDIALIREVFAFTEEAAGILGIDSLFAARLSELANELPPYRVGKYGQLQEWESDFDEPEPEHRHISHLYPVFPGVEISSTATPELARAAGISLQRRIASGGANTGWSRAWAAGVLARLGDGPGAHQSILYLIDRLSSRTLLDLHPGAKGPMFQIDGNFAGGAVMMEMLLQSQSGVIEFLPALPSVWSHGRLTGARARGNITVDMSWSEGRLRTVTLHAGSDKAVRLRTPALQRISAVLRNGDPVAFDLLKDEYRVSVLAGSSYTLELAPH